MKTFPLKLPLCCHWLKRILHRATTSPKVFPPKHPPKLRRRHITTIFFEMP